MKQMLLLVAILAQLTFPAPGEEAFYIRPQIRADGDYLTNTGPVQAKAPSGRLSAGALWRVLTPNLNCRRQPDPQAAIVRGFRRGTLLQADIGGGGSDEVLYNVQDNRGHTWMRVRSAQGLDYHCYVRAHRRFIAPLSRLRFEV